MYSCVLLLSGLKYLFTQYSSTITECWVFIINLLIFTTRKQSLGQGNVFTGVCPGTGGVGFPACITAHMTGGVCLWGVWIQVGGTGATVIVFFGAAVMATSQRDGIQNILCNCDIICGRISSDTKVSLS